MCALRFHRHQTDDRLFGLDGIPGFVRDTGIGDCLHKAFDIFQEKTALTAHLEVGADQIGLPTLAKPRLPPLAVPRHHRVDSFDRQLEGEYAQLLAVLEDRCGDKRRRIVIGGQVGGEVGQIDRACILQLHRSAVGLCQSRIGEGAVFKRSGVIQLLEHGVNHISGSGIDQEDVVVAKPLLQLPDARMIVRVCSAVTAAVVAEIELILAAEGIGIVDDVALLKSVCVIS